LEKGVLIVICLQFVFSCGVSFRAVPKILKVISSFFCQNKTRKIPHFTTVIRWSLKTGLSLLKKAVSCKTQEWICIADHTIQVGTKKALVVLKVLPEKLKSERALTLSDVTVVALAIKDKWNGRIVQQVIESVIEKIGHPIQFVIDGGSDLKKGVQDTLGNLGKNVKVTYDLTHFLAKLLKRKYENNGIFKEINKLISETRRDLLQTSLAFLIPPPERKKSRFLNLGATAKWIEKMLWVLSNKQFDGRVEGCLSWMRERWDDLTYFCQDIKIVFKIQEKLKNRGLNDSSYAEVLTLIGQFLDCEMKSAILEYLKEEF